MELQPVTLTGQFVRLEPLAFSHVSDLTSAGQDESIWKYMLYGDLRAEENMHAWVSDILARQSKGTDLPFSVIHLESGRAIGATRYMNIAMEHRRLEIGGTWYGKAYQGTLVNTECKYLLLRYAFETLGCIRVELKTDGRNLQSQRAIERLGAVKEGVFRKHIITPGGFIRDSVYYSIIDSEWPDVKQKLAVKLSPIPDA